MQATTSWLAKVGPGVITGAADDDPSGIATYSHAGAKFGFDLLWTMVLLMPEMKENLKAMADQVDAYTLGVVAMQLDALASYPNRVKGQPH